MHLYHRFLGATDYEREALGILDASVLQLLHRTGVMPLARHLDLESDEDAIHTCDEIGQSGGHVLRAVNLEYENTFGSESILDRSANA